MERGHDIMTVGTDVKNSYFTIKSAEAALQMLKEKTINEESKLAFQQAEKLITVVKQDLHKQVLYLTREEPQY